MCQAFSLESKFQFLGCDPEGDRNPDTTLLNIAYAALRACILEKL
jgi:hypothetical protein